MSNVTTIGRDISINRAALGETRTPNGHVAICCIGVMRVRRIIGGKVIGAIFRIVTIDHPGGTGPGKTFCRLERAGEGPLRDGHCFDTSGDLRIGDSLDLGVVTVAVSVRRQKMIVFEIDLADKAVAFCRDVHAIVHSYPQ